MHRLVILLALPARPKHQPGRDAIDPDSARRKRPGGKIGQPGQRLLRQSIAEIIGIGRGELRIEQVDDETRPRLPGARARAGRSAAPGARTLTAICGASSFAVELAESVPGEARGIVDQQRRPAAPPAHSKNGVRAIRRPRGRRRPAPRLRAPYRHRHGHEPRPSSRRRSAPGRSPPRRACRPR